MIAYRANLRSFLTYYDMAAVTALPDAVTVSGENDLVLDILKKLTVSFLMLLFDSGNTLEKLSYLIKTLLLYSSSWSHMLLLRTQSLHRA